MHNIPKSNGIDTKPVVQLVNSLVTRAHRVGNHDSHEHDHSIETDDILSQYQKEAERLHERIAHEHDILSIEFLGATGSGKTTLIEQVIDHIGTDASIGVIVGDVAGDDDAQRFKQHDVAVSDVSTGKECHLDPGLVENALSDFDLSEIDVLFIENVGNMVCPADFPLGAQARVLVVSTTEGDDVVRKHPVLFQSCDIGVINKVDIAAAVGVSVDQMHADIKDINPDMPVFKTNAQHPETMQSLLTQIDELRTHDHAHH